MVEQHSTVRCALVDVCRFVLLNAVQNSQTAVQHSNCLVQICADTLAIYGYTDLQAATDLFDCAQITCVDPCYTAIPQNCNLQSCTDLRHHGFMRPCI